ncbi:PREDICTED: uncharacterized protein LOC108528852 [Rhinopithecus bieti]|uniref:uncharacterized protein LOC108528852 n=1 Tax=Rhinopithecus bieti TaxID=61621 RepID=UPI00083C4A64|nr:PREDICTED: uncharacterized protein LOC108528852 [Rhinopithecus bieti]
MKLLEATGDSIWLQDTKLDTEISTLIYGTREGRTSPGRGGQRRACAVGGAESSLRTRRSAGRTHAAQLAKLQTARRTAQCASSARRRERERKLRRGSVGFSTTDKDAFPDRRPEPCSFAIRQGLQRASSSIWAPLSRKSPAIPFQIGSFRGEFSSVDSDLLRLTSLGNPASRGTSAPGHTCFTPAPAPPRQQAHSQVVRLRMDHELSKRKKSHDWTQRLRRYGTVHKKHLVSLHNILLDSSKSVSFLLYNQNFSVQNKVGRRVI